MREHHKGRSLFQLIDKKSFDNLANKWEMDKGVRSFTTWEMTQALLCAFVMRLGSYREVESALKIPDSTFGDALRERHCGFFQELCELTLLRIKAETKNRKIKKAIHQLLAIDSTECCVHGSLFNKPGWRQKQSIGHKASAKFHAIWDIEGEWIEDFRVTGSRKHDLTIAKTFELSKGNFYVFDRAYVDLRFWLDIIESESHFVTRLKRAPRNEAIHSCVLSKDDAVKNGVLWEGEWTPSEAACYRNKIKLKKLKFRHIIYRDPISKKIFDFITSDWDLLAQEIAEIYKHRWRVELLFRWLKGHLDIRRFPTKTINAVKTQLAIAVLVQLLLQLKRILEKFKGSQWELLRQIRTGLVQRILAVSGPPNACRWNPASIKDLTTCVH